MQQVRVHGPDDVRLDEVADPEPGPGDVVVRVAACGLCGSDLSYARLGGLAGPGAGPMCLGHEVAGTVDWAGAEVTTVEVGQRVAVHPGEGEPDIIGNGGPQGGLTPRLLVTDADRGRLYPVPDDLPLEMAALAEPLAVGMHAADQADVGPGDGVCVFGCGPIGLAAIAWLVDRGHERVVAVDPSPTRLALARHLGAFEVVDPSGTDVWSVLADVHGTAPFMFGPTPATAGFIEASGSDRVIGQVLAHAAVGAHLSVVALHYDPVPTSFLTVMMKEIVVRGSIGYGDRFADALDLLARRDLSRLVTHRFPLFAATEAIDVMRRGTDCGKVLVTVDPDQR